MASAELERKNALAQRDTAEQMDSLPGFLPLPSVITPRAAQRWCDRRGRGQGLRGSSGGIPGVAWSYTDAPSAPAFQGEITLPSNEEGPSSRCLTASREGKESNYLCGTQGS